MGSPEFAVPALQQLLGLQDHTVVGVFTGSDKKRGRGGALSPTPVKEVAIAAGIPVFEHDNTRTDAFEHDVRALAPDLIVVVAYKVLPVRILNIPVFGCINVHASLLPKYRGAAPIHWAVINGEQETGVTVFMLNEQIDAGAILARASTKIELTDTTGSLYSRLMLLGANLLVDVVQQLASGTAKAEPQVDAESTPAPKVFPEMGHITFDLDALAVHNRIRGFTPHPGAWAMLDNVRVKLFGSNPVDINGLQPGACELREKQFLIGCSRGAVAIQSLQFPNRPKVDAAAWLASNPGKHSFF